MGAGVCVDADVRPSEGRQEEVARQLRVRSQPGGADLLVSRDLVGGARAALAALRRAERLGGGGGLGQGGLGGGGLGGGGGPLRRDLRATFADRACARHRRAVSRDAFGLLGRAGPLFLFLVAALGCQGGGGGGGDHEPFGLAVAVYDGLDLDVTRHVLIGTQWVVSSGAKDLPVLKAWPEASAGGEGSTPRVKGPGQLQGEGEGEGQGSLAAGEAPTGAIVDSPISRSAVCAASRAACESSPSSLNTAIAWVCVGGADSELDRQGTWRGAGRWSSPFAYVARGGVRGRDAPAAGAHHQPFEPRRPRLGK